MVRAEAPLAGRRARIAGYQEQDGSPPFLDRDEGATGSGGSLATGKLTLEALASLLSSVWSVFFDASETPGSLRR